jgi:hypothetical protein
MTDLSIQRNNTITSAYVSTAAAAAPAAAAKPAPQAASSADSVSISPEAQKLFELSITDEPITPMNGGGIRPPDEPPAKPVKD